MYLEYRTDEKTEFYVDSGGRPVIPPENIRKAGRYPMIIPCLLIVLMCFLFYALLVFLFCGAGYAVLLLGCILDLAIRSFHFLFSLIAHKKVPEEKMETIFTPASKIVKEQTVRAYEYLIPFSREPRQFWVEEGPVIFKKDQSLRKIAESHRDMLITFWSLLACGLIFWFNRENFIGGIAFFIGILYLINTSHYVCRLSRALKHKLIVTIAYAFGCFIPVVSFIVVYLLAREAYRNLIGSGYKVGFFGMSKKDIEKIR